MAQQSLSSLLDELSSSTNTESKVATLEKISKLDKTEKLQDAVKSHDLILILAKVMKENLEKWARNIPGWAVNIIERVYSIREVKHKNTLALVDVLLEMFCVSENSQSIWRLGNILFTKNKLDFIDHTSLKCALSKCELSASKVFTAATDLCDEWQLKLLQDKQVVLRLLDMERWGTLMNLAQHPDAKELIPHAVLDKARVDTSEDSYCKGLYAILCNELDVASLQLDKKYVTGQAYKLKSLLDNQTHQGDRGSNLLDIVLPLLNLSINDANKDIMGELLIGLLLQVVSIKYSDQLTNPILFCLERGRREAAKTLWNLAFSESNRKRIENENGIEILELVSKEIKDSVMQQNIAGILFMFKKSTVNEAAPPTNILRETGISSGKPSPNEAVVPTRGPHKKGGHVMISYNWSHQPIIIRLANSLKEHGYTVWLDIEQTKGSSLGAMADAIEGSAVVLLCISQKYKDSPNCRLEGEYCIQRKISCIPLKVQRGYQADGWLGLILGSVLYHNFTDDGDWDKRITALVKEIGERGKETSITQPDAQSSPNSRETKDWTTKEVLSWLQSNNMSHHCDSFAKSKIDGKALLELKTLLLYSPHNLYSQLLEKLNVVDPGEVIRLNIVLRNCN